MPRIQGILHQLLNFKQRTISKLDGSMEFFKCEYVRFHTLTCIFGMMKRKETMNLSEGSKKWGDCQRARGKWDEKGVEVVN